MEIIDLYPRISDLVGYWNEGLKTRGDHYHLLADAGDYDAARSEITKLRNDCLILRLLLDIGVTHLSAKLSRQEMSGQEPLLCLLDWMSEMTICFHNNLTFYSLEIGHLSFRSGEFARAIADFRSGLVLMPKSQELAEALAVAKMMVE